MKIFNHVLEVKFSSRQSWSHLRLHTREYWSHLVWGKLSVVFGQPHLEPIRVCADCSEEIQVLSHDYLDYCSSCQQIEGRTEEITTEEYERRHS